MEGARGYCGRKEVVVKDQELQRERQGEERRQKRGEGEGREKRREGEKKKAEGKKGRQKREVESRKGRGLGSQVAGRRSRIAGRAVRQFAVRFAVRFTVRLQSVCSPFAVWIVGSDEFEFFGGVMCCHRHSRLCAVAVERL